MEINLHDETPEKEFASLQIKPYIEGSFFQINFLLSTAFLQECIINNKKDSLQNKGVIAAFIVHVL